MVTNTEPKFSKVELLIKSKSSDLPSTLNISFENCGFMITGDYIVIIIDEKNEDNNTVTSTGKIFSLKEITAYKTHLK